MEGLVLLIAGLVEAAVAIVPLIVEVIVLATVFVGELLSLLIQLVLAMLQPAVLPDQASITTQPREPFWQRVQAVRKGRAGRPQGRWFTLWRRWSRRLLIGTSVLFAVTLVAVLIVNQFYFGALVRWASADLPQRHGVTLQFSEADGNLFTGHVHLTQATVKRPQHPSATFDVTIDDVEADVDVWQLLRREIELEHVTAKGIRGAYTRVGPQPEQLPRHGYVICQLQLEDVELLWGDATRPNGPFVMVIEIDQLETAPFRSTWAAFDVLFRSNGSGRIAGGAFTLATREVPDGRETEWHAKDVPVTLAAGYLGGPFRWITEGTIDVDVIDRWQLPDGDADIEMDWGLTFRNVRAATPADLSAPARVIAEPVVTYFNTHTEEVPLRLQVTISKGEFTGRMSPPLELITGAVADAATKALAEKLGVARKQIEEEGREFLEKARELLKRDEAEE
jgi:hypothetical protein